MDFPSLVVGLWLGVVIAALAVALGLYLGDRRVEQRRKLSAVPPPDAPPEVCGGAGDPDETPEDRLRRDPDAWKDA